MEDHEYKKSVQASLNSKRRIAYFENQKLKLAKAVSEEEERKINNVCSQKLPNYVNEVNNINVSSNQEEIITDEVIQEESISNEDPEAYINIIPNYKPLIIQNENGNDYLPENIKINQPMCQLFESVYLTECADIMNKFFQDDDDDESDSDESNNIKSAYTRMESLDLKRIKDFNVTIPVDNLVTTLIFNITKSNDRDVSHLYSVEMFVNELNDWFCMAKVSQKDRKTHEELMHKYYPISQNSVTEYKSSTKYEDGSVDYLEYDCCDKGCIVYAGEFANLRRCPNCVHNLSRFFPCVVCVKNGLDGLAPCNHNASNCLPRRTIRYRSIKLLLTKLLQYETFREALKYEFVDNETDKYCSSMDGESYIRNKTEMQEQFNRYKASLSLDDNEIELVIVMGSWFYDGVQVFNSITSDMTPLFFSFHNLPHCLRTEHGVGSFLISLFTFKKEGPVEDFLMNDCFISELEELSKGFEIVIDGKRYFVLLRLICHIQDLMGYNSILKSQNMAKSNWGCIFDNCGSGRSIHFNESKHAEPKYDGQRQYISIRHPTRTNGFSRNCCPSNYYNEPSNNKLWVKGDPTKVADFNENQINFNDLNLCVKDDKQQNILKNFLDPSGYQCPYFWLDRGNSEYKDYKKYLLHYPHACYIPRIEYIRTTNEELTRRALLAIQNEEPYEGIRAAWAFLYLQYVKFQTDVSPSDSMHTFKNICVDFMKLWKNDKLSRAKQKTNPDIKEETTKAKKSKKVYISADDESDIPPWAFKTKEQTKADCYLSCLLIPYGCSTKFKMPPVFGQTGNLKIHQLIKVFAVLINLVLLASKNMKFAYKQHHRMFARIINRMRAPTVYKLDILPLYWRAREWLCLLEGLYPVSEMTIMKHFIPDLILHIRNQGPLHTFHSLFGEMLVAVAKRKIKRNGGTKLEISAYEKIFELENMKIRKTYGSSLKSMMDPSSALKSEYKSLSYDLEKKVFKVDFRKNDLTSGISSNAVIESFEFDEIVNFIYHLVESKVINVINDAIILSSFYRVIFFLKKQRLSNEDSIYTVAKRLYEQLIIENKRENLVIDSVNLPKNDLISVVKNGNLLLSDIETLYDIFNELIKCFKYKLNGSINGISYHSRGFGHSQKIGIKLPKMDSKLNQEDQDKLDISENLIFCSYHRYLNDHWHQKADYSSWCKLQTKCYAQLNYLFTLKLNSDSFVSSLYLASVSSRKTIPPDFSINYEEISGNDLYNEMLPISHINLSKPNLRQQKKENLPLFVEFNNILPTEVASIGFVKRGLDFIPIDCGISSNENKIPDSEYCFNYKENKPPFVARLNDPNFPIEILGFIDLSPENFVEKEGKKSKDGWNIFDEINWMDMIWDHD